jgi:histidine triad (HIT) family protein
MASVFTKIVAGEIPCYKVAEDERFLAFLDAFPLKQGHTLVIPKRETNYLFDLSEQDYADLMSFTRKVAIAVKNAVPCDRCSIHVIGLEVPHAHVHIVPINSVNDCNFANPKLKFSKEEFTETAKKIANQIA